jgi:hypothetical protein
MFCINCGIELQDGSKFCLHCGTPLKVSEKSSDKIPEPLVSTEYANVSANKDENLLKELTNAVEEETVNSEDNSQPEITQENTEITKPVTQETAEMPKYDSSVYTNFATQITSAPVPPVSNVSETVINDGATTLKPYKSRTVLSVVLCIFLCVFAFITPALFSVYDYLNNDVPVVIENINILELAEEADLDIVDEIKYNVPKQYLSYYNVKNSDVEETLEKVKLTEAVKIYNGYLAAFKEGNEKYEIKPRNIVAIVEDNEKLIEKQYGYSFNENTYLKLQGRIEDNYYWSDTSVHNFLKEADVAVWIPQVILASYPYIISFILLLICFAAILFFNIKRLRCLLLVSIPFLISGLFYTIFSFIVSELYSGQYSGFYREFIAPLKSDLRICGLALLFLGVISLAVYIIVKKLLSKKVAGNARLSIEN